MPGEGKTMKSLFAAALVVATIIGPVTAQSQSRPKNAPAACPSSEFDGFFEEFIRSSDVRRRYTGPTIEERSITAPERLGIVRPATPKHFDITFVDYTWADAASVQRWEKDSTPFTKLSLDMKKLPNGNWRVKYQPAIFRDDGEGDSETLIRKIGKPRAYVFAPVGGCWKLVQWLK
jgi:hypothetical protein